MIILYLVDNPEYIRDDPNQTFVFFSIGFIFL